MSGTYKRLPAVALQSGTTVVATTTQPTRTTASISSALATDAIMNNLTALTPKFAKANIASATTDGALITAVALKKLRVLSAAVVVGATATDVTFNSKSGGAGTALSALFACGVNGGFVLPFNPVGWFETTAGEGLTATTGTGSTAGIQISYIEV